MAKNLNCAIVIPCFNPNIAELKRAIVSILDPVQSSRNSVQVILVDDCSPTDSSALYGPILEEFPAATLLRLPQNCGPGVARNAGIDFALSRTETDIVGFLDADDEMLAEWTQVLDLLDGDQSALVVSYGYLKNDKPFGTKPITSLRDWFDGPFTRVSSIFARASYLKHSSIRFLPTRVGEDTEFIWRLISAGGWRHIPCAVSHYHYDFKDHLIYPHPLHTSCIQDPAFFQLADNSGLFGYVCRINERNGLMLRRIRPWNARYLALPTATFQFLAGAVTRKIIKSVFRI